jgi:hypothetical protein
MLFSSWSKNSFYPSSRCTGTTTSDFRLPWRTPPTPVSFLCESFCSKCLFSIDLKSCQSTSIPDTTLCLSTGSPSGVRPMSNCSDKWRKQMWIFVCFFLYTGVGIRGATPNEGLVREPVLRRLCKSWSRMTRMSRVCSEKSVFIVKW